MKGKSLQLPGLKSSRSATDLIKILASLVVSTFARIGMILKELDFLVVKELIEPRQSSMRHRKKVAVKGFTGESGRLFRPSPDKVYSLLLMLLVISFDTL